jgi:hypothetical protein
MTSSFQKQKLRTTPLLLELLTMDLDPGSRARGGGWLRAASGCHMCYIAMPQCHNTQHGIRHVVYGTGCPRSRSALALEAREERRREEAAAAAAAAAMAIIHHGWWVAVAAHVPRGHPPPISGLAGWGWGWGRRGRGAGAAACLGVG